MPSSCCLSFDDCQSPNATGATLQHKDTIVNFVEVAAEVPVDGLVTPSHMVVTTSVDIGNTGFGQLNDVVTKGGRTQGADPEVSVPSITRRLLLTEKGRSYVMSHFQADAVEDRTYDIEQRDNVGWDNLYDTRGLTLLQANKRLRECHHGGWELKVYPSVASRLSDSLVPGGDNIVTDIDDILQGVGASRRMDETMSLKAHLFQLGIRPFARLRVERCRYLVPALQDTVEINVEHVQFNSVYAEPAVLSAFLAEDTDIGELMRVTFAEFRVCRNLSRSDSEANVLRGFLRSHKLDTSRGGSGLGACAVAAYLRVCRPAQYRSVTQAGIILEPQPAVSVDDGALSDETGSEDESVYRI